MDAVVAILTVYDENRHAVESALLMLSLMDDTRDWYAELASAALSWQPFIDRGLVIDTWLAMIASDL